VALVRRLQRGGEVPVKFDPMQPSATWLRQGVIPNTRFDRKSNRHALSFSARAAPLEAGVVVTLRETRYWIAHSIRSGVPLIVPPITSGRLPTLAESSFSGPPRPQRAVWSIDQRPVASPVVICHTSPPQLSSAPVCLPL
jgi:hypothetical protein